jgi:hypothetical protein
MSRIRINKKGKTESIRLVVKYMGWVWLRLPDKLHIVGINIKEMKIPGSFLVITRIN